MKDGQGLRGQSGGTHTLPILPDARPRSHLVPAGCGSGQMGGERRPVGEVWGQQ